ncbi:hypothetical protein P700755_001237 [Psychroflexus torquis ATCC 700755]|uniref:Secreted protein n=1 Tax=Psychroflexus torquis (strain ATCC 700755 / CIP 106069 / ACAM 623) TaxID=313595 RepID=K4ICN6_PSYTT|nr:hypothetical protein [Psychroflexus torquis]AFU68174.1 hypothetical protein P700755_001237 [Psychroflexus torquis ATCC 700755]
MKKLLLVNLLFLLVSFNSFGQEKETKLVEITGTEVPKTRGENPNIKTDFVCDAPDVAVAKPAATRGSTCTINVDNYTGFDIKVYVDGYFEGWVHPWDEGSVTVIGGYTEVYCMTSGGSYEWEATGDCDSYFTYKLTESNSR